MLPTKEYDYWEKNWCFPVENSVVVFNINIITVECRDVPFIVTLIFFSHTVRIVCIIINGKCAYIITLEFRKIK